MHTVDPCPAATRAVARHGGKPGALLPILHDIQRELGCVPPHSVQVIAHALHLSRAEIHGVITFYPHLRTEPAGRHVLAICRAESCLAMGGARLAEHAQASLGCGFHGTTADGRITLEPVYCLGLCAQSPAVALDGAPHARITPARLDRLIEAAP